MIAHTFVKRGLDHGLNLVCFAALKITFTTFWTITCCQWIFFTVNYFNFIVWHFGRLRSLAKTIHGGTNNLTPNDDLRHIRLTFDSSRIPNYCSVAVQGSRPRISQRLLWSTDAFIVTPTKFGWITQCLFVFSMHNNCSTNLAAVWVILVLNHWT